jgi:hypothetical protein
MRKTLRWIAYSLIVVGFLAGAVFFSLSMDYSGTHRSPQPDTGKVVAVLNRAGRVVYFTSDEAALLPWLQYGSFLTMLSGALLVIFTASTRTPSGNP